MGNSLYTKYRPQTFNEVIGQDIAKKILTNSILEDKINHAYLFFGIRGTGKTTLARIFAKAVNCEHLDDEANPCDKCNSCKEIAACASMDVIEIDAASNNGVDEIRNLTEKTNYFATSLKYKVYIIDEVHMLSKSAFNALLKTLEEPPENTIFLLATTEINKIPETILSRTIIINLEILSSSSILKGIKYILEKEQITYEEKALDYIVLIAGGSLRDAITALETILLYSHDFNEENVVKALGIIKYQEVEKLLETNILELAELINTIDKDPKKIIHLLIDVLTTLVRRGKREYRELLGDILNIFISIKDPSLLKISLYSLLILSAGKKESVNVSHETITNNKVVKEESLNKEVDEKNQSTLIKTSSLDAPLNSKLPRLDLKTVDQLENLNQNVKEVENPIEPVQEIKKENNKEVSDIKETPKNESIYNVISDYLTLESYLTILFEHKESLLEKVKKRWEFIASYSSNEKYKPFIQILLKATPLAVNKQAIVIGFENEKDVNELKIISLDKKLIGFINEIVGDDLFLLPVTPDNWTKMKKVHKQLLKKGSVIIKPIIIPEKILSDNDADHTLIKELFGDKLEYE